MARGDIVPYDDATRYAGDEVFAVAAGVTIYAGEPVAKALGGYVVTALATNKPVVATDYIAGIASGDSTATASVAGTVTVTKMVPGQSWLISPNVAATWDTQAEYDLLVGDRVLLDLTSSTYTILASDSSTSGCVIMPLDVTKYPGKVRFAFREGTNYLA